MKILRPKYHLPPTPEEEAEIKAWMAKLNAFGNNINLMDDNDPEHVRRAKREDDDNENPEHGE